MNTKEYVQSLFSDYEETEGLKDFMEEIQSNLDARIASLAKKGLSEQEAFDKSCAELGDISVLAKDFSLKKRREVFEDAYMDLRNYMKGGRVAAYVIFGLIAVFGLIIAFIAYFSVRWNSNSFLSFHSHWIFGNEWPFTREIGIIGFCGALLPFLVTSISGYTFLGLTQETKSHFPMSRKRAAWYTVAAGLISFGLIIMALVYFSVKMTGFPVEIIATIAVLIPFVLPGGGLLVYLLLTEKSRLKPWAASMRDDAIRQEMKTWEDPATASRFGMFSGSIWIFAAALFVLLGFLVGFRFSWVVFLFAVAFQLLVQGFMSKRSK